MTRSELHRRVAEGEGPQLEFKHKLPEWDKLMREVVAFANTNGGLLLIGVSDDGTIRGTRDPREIAEILDEKLRIHCRPVPPFEIEAVPLSQKRAVVAVHIPEGSEKPYRVLSDPEAETGPVLIRIADSSVTASREMIQLLKYEGQEKNMKVEYGAKEDVLMKYLAEHPHVTVSEYARLAGIKRSAASRTLIHLAKARVLRLRPRIEQEDIFLRNRE